MEKHFDYDRSGFSVSLSSDGTIVAIGAPYNAGEGGAFHNIGHVRVYQYNPNSGGEATGEWEKLGQDIDGEVADDRSGYSVSLSSDGTIVAIGAHYNFGDVVLYSGHVRVYQYNPREVEKVHGEWEKIGQDIDGEADYDRSGYSVSLSSDGTIVAMEQFIMLVKAKEVQFRIIEDMSESISIILRRRRSLMVNGKK